ncbi:MAG: ATP-dependent DNA helicase RecQ [Bacteroidetes bacterium GWA2_32_17]|nr:MAG: ATP-dependent DNA helicase RecQ [Bacteroidetes bacterium GWA2_32_17]
MDKTKEKTLHQLLKKHFGFNTFKGNQEEIIDNLLAGKDTFVLLPTGGGKSLCYQLPAIIMEGTAIIISPLIALMKNQVDAIRNFSSEEGIANFLNSSLNKTEIKRVKDEVSSGKTKMLYVAPESLTKEENVEFLRNIKISFYAVDEAHCISEWGHDFRPEYRRIRPIINEIGKAPVIALTATATPKVQHDILKTLEIIDANVYKFSFNRPNLYYEIRPKIGATKEIIRFIKNNEGKSGIVYCLSRRRVEEMAEQLVANGIKALPYHAGLDSQTRVRNQDAFLMETADVIVATIAFGMGIDKPDVRFVIHYDIPKSLEGYYQETGRSGRDGGEGQCITFYSYDDIQKLEKFMQGKPVAEQEIGKQLLFETVSYAESSVCRRKLLLHYFGEEYTQNNCENCDNCLNPKTQFDGSESIVTVLQCIVEVQEKFKAEHISDILCGNATSSIKTYNHHNLESFGIGSDENKKYWLAVIRQSMIKKFIIKDIENYGLLSVSDEGKKFMEVPYEIMLMRDHEYEEGDDDDMPKGQVGDNAADPIIFAMLKDLRKQFANKQKLPPFVIFQDPSLEEMAIQYPITMDEMKNIVGVGEGKAKKFGQPFIELITKYVEENEIERPQDMVVKSVINKSSLKVFIIQSIDRKIPLDDICNAKGVDFEELLNELEAIVYSGTKINLNYAISQVIDEEKQLEVYDYFRNADSDNLEDALKELGEDDYSMDEIRLMRLKFISEMGN